MSESIQNPSTICLELDSHRREFLTHAAELYGRPPALGLDDQAFHDLDDAGAILLAFPWLSDPELTEALWALAQF